MKFEIVRIDEFEREIKNDYDFMELVSKVDGKSANIYKFSSLIDWAYAVDELKRHGYYSCSIGGVARFLGVYRQLVWNWVWRDGRIPALVYEAGELEKYIEIPLRRVDEETKD